MSCKPLLQVRRVPAVAARLTPDHPVPVGRAHGLPRIASFSGGSDGGERWQMLRGKLSSVRTAEVLHAERAAGERLLALCRAKETMGVMSHHMPQAMS